MIALPTQILLAPHNPHAFSLVFAYIHTDTLIDPPSMLRLLKPCVHTHEIKHSDDPVPAARPPETVVLDGDDKDDADAAASRACFIDARRVISR